MAIGRISGAMLYENQERQGIDLRFEGDLIYLDVNDNQIDHDGRVGIKTSSPQHDFDVNGEARFGNVVISTNTIAPDLTHANLELNTNSTGRVRISSAYYLPNTDGNVGYALVTDGAGSVTFEPISTTLSLAGDDGNEDISLLTDSLSIIGGESILTTLNSAILTIDANIATTVSRGVASFETNNFSVTDGAVSVRDDYVQDVAGAMISGVGATHENISVSYDNITHKIVFDVPTATTTSLGVAQFDTNNFVVTDGVVTINTNISEDVTGALLANATQSGISISYDNNNNLATFTVDTATSSTKGISSFSNTYFTVTDGDVAINDASNIDKGIAVFDSNNFTVSSGLVTSKNITIGTSTVDLGATLLSISDLQSLTVDNVKIDGNEISSLDADGNISLNPSGTGVILVNNSRIVGVSTPVDNDDAVNKGYVDNYFVNFNDDRIVSGNTSIIANNTSVVITVDGVQNSYFSNIGFTVGNLSLSDNTITSLDGATIDFDITSAINLPSGTIAQRPAQPVAGDIRYNAELASVEFYDGTVWVKMSNNIESQIVVPDGSSDSYSLDQSATTDSILVSLNGVIQSPAAYSVSGTTITFVEIPQVTDIIDVRFLATTVATRLASPTAPSSSTSTGNSGQVAYDNTYIYVCIAQNTWVRAALSTW
jgi:hypothetical protein